MTSATYRKLSRESGRSGDEFYTCMSEWLKNRRTEDMRSSCLSKAELYGSALEREIAYLTSLPKGEKVEEALATAVHYRELLLGQIERVLNSAIKH
jgi:hypothetical protein